MIVQRTNTGQTACGPKAVRSLLAIAAGQLGALNSVSPDSLLVPKADFRSGGIAKHCGTSFEQHLQVWCTHRKDRSMVRTLEAERTVATQSRILEALP